jgi:tricorn protease
VQIDFDNCSSASSRCRRAGAAVLAAAGRRGRDVFYLEAPAGPGSAGSTLHRYRLSERRRAPSQRASRSTTLSADGRKLLYRTPAAAGRRGARGPAARPRAELFLVDADRNGPGRPAGAAQRVAAHVPGPKEEFRQIFNEGWRLQRDYLYVQNMHGSDWPKMKQMYGELLPHVRHRADLNYLLDNMGAEIAVGHSYVRGGDMPETSRSRRAGLLGADFVVENGPLQDHAHLRRESWNPDLRAPLAAPGVDVSVGDFIVAVNGVELRAPDNIYRLLDGTANRQTVLTVNDGRSWRARAGDRGAGRQRAGPAHARLGGGQPPHGRQAVQGQLAYVHVPNTGQGGYTSFNRYYFAQQDKQGAVIDERFNGGGSAADYIIDVLQRDFDGYFNNVAGDRYPFTSPSAGIWGPKVMIINEMAGSGGDLMPLHVPLRGIGPLVGKRTWGGLVHTADTPPSSTAAR